MANLHELADRLRTLPSVEIDLIYNVLLQLERHHDEEIASTVRERFDAVVRDRNEVDKEHNEALDVLLSICDLDEQGTLFERFEKVLQEAGITLEEGSVSGSTSVAEPDVFQDMNVQAAQFDHQRLLTQAIEAWRDALQVRQDLWLGFENPNLNAQADAFYRFNLLDKALSHWWNTYRETMQPLYVQEDGLQVRNDDKLLRNITREWVLKARAGQFVRVQDLRIAGAALDAMSQKYEEVRALESVMIYEPLLVQNHLEKWQSRVSEAKKRDVKAEDARDYFVMVRSLRKWRSIVRYRKLAREEQKNTEKRTSELRIYIKQLKFFQKWRNVVKARKVATYNLAYKAIRTKNKENIARAALAEWSGKAKYIDTMNDIAYDFCWQKQEQRVRVTAHGAITTIYNKAMEKKDDEEKADQIYQRSLLNRTGVVQKWEAKVSKIKQDKSRADELLSIKDAQLAGNSLRKMNNKAFGMSRRQEDAEAFHGRQDKKRNLSVLEKWRRAAAEKRGRLGLPPVTPAVRRSQLLLVANTSTTPAYSPFVDRLQGRNVVRRLFEEQGEDDNDNEEDTGDSR